MKEEKKTSKEILSELFDKFNATPPSSPPLNSVEHDNVNDDTEKKKECKKRKRVEDKDKSKRKRKKEKKSKSRKHRSKKSKKKKKKQRKSRSSTDSSSDNSLNSDSESDTKSSKKKEAHSDSDGYKKPKTEKKSPPKTKNIKEEKHEVTGKKSSLTPAPESSSSSCTNNVESSNNITSVHIDSSKIVKSECNENVSDIEDSKAKTPLENCDDIESGKSSVVLPDVVPVSCIEVSSVLDSSPKLSEQKDTSLSQTDIVSQVADIFVEELLESTYASKSSIPEKTKVNIKILDLKKSNILELAEQKQREKAEKYEEGEITSESSQEDNDALPTLQPVETDDTTSLPISAKDTGSAEKSKSCRHKTSHKSRKSRSKERRRSYSKDHSKRKRTRSKSKDKRSRSRSRGRKKRRSISLDKKWDKNDKRRDKEKKSHRDRSGHRKRKDGERKTSKDRKDEKPDRDKKDSDKKSEKEKRDLKDSDKKNEKEKRDLKDSDKKNEKEKRDLKDSDKKNEKEKRDLKDKRKRSKERRSKSRERRRNKSKSPLQLPSMILQDNPKKKRRSRSRSRTRGLEIDKKKLLEIARKNALSMLKQQGCVVAATDSAKVATITAGGKTVDELTDFCKQLSQKEGKDDNIELSPITESSEDEGEKAFHHPFLIKDRPTNIVMNIRNCAALPVKTHQEKTAEAAAQLRLQFPVSSGQHHRRTENEWVPVEPKKEEPPAPVKSNKGGNKPVPVADSSPLAIEPPPPPPPELVSVFPALEDSVNINIGDVVGQKLAATKRLVDNPADYAAMKLLRDAEDKLSRWNEANQLQQPGLFTGSTGARLLTPAELASGQQAWAKKDQLMCAQPVTGGIGSHLLQKMGWKPGEGLGKNHEGTLEPLSLPLKMDKRGLVCAEEVKKPPRFLNTIRHPKKQTVKSLEGKHPVSLLLEYCSKRHLNPPIFSICHESGPSHKRVFLFKVEVNGVQYQPPVPSNNKKQAKSEAAMICLKALGLMPSTSVPVIID